MTGKLVKFVFVIVLLFLLSGCKPEHWAIEAEVKSGVHRVQIALERYATDHKGEYPKVIYGGDKEGWEYYKANLPEGETGISDPLIEGKYLESYPENPFIIISGDGKVEIRSGGPDRKAISKFLEAIKDGDGEGFDPRFGMNGGTMGNVLLEPFIFVGPDKPDDPKDLRMCPGQFFYMSADDLRFLKDEDAIQVEKPHDWPGSETVRYYLGGFGGMQTQGLDVIRFTDIAGDVPPEFPHVYKNQSYITARGMKAAVTVGLRVPEVFGGGEYGELPSWPPWDAGGKFIYGAPDGFKDGVVITLVAERDH